MTAAIRHPGPPASPRIVAVPAAALPIEDELPAGMPLLDALAALLARHRVESACLTLSGGGFGPFAYVIPALSPDGANAAFYSDTRRPAGTARLDIAAVTVGLRDAAPFFHCHALWTEADGRLGCGHVLPAGTFVAAPIRVQGAGLLGARFEVHADPETGFSLFHPVSVPLSSRPGTYPAMALRLAPNQDLVHTLEQVAAEAGFESARIQGGVASIIGARFTDAPPVTGFATELLVRSGQVFRHPGKTVLDVGLIDFNGTVGIGRLVPGENPVLITFEGLLQAG